MQRKSQNRRDPGMGVVVGVGMGLLLGLLFKKIALGLLLGLVFAYILYRNFK